MENRKTKVLAFCLSKIPSALVGVIYPLENLASRGYIEFEFSETLNVTKKNIAEADVVVCIRSSESIEYDIVKECKRLGKYILFFLDDDLLNIPETAKCFPYFDNEMIRNNIESIMKISNCLWTTNKNIEKKYKQYFQRSVTLNAPALLQCNKSIEKITVDNEDTIKIGFAGGIDHSEYLNEVLEKPISKIIEIYKDKVQFEFFGAKPAFIDKYPIKYIPHESNYENYKNIIINRGWDIALAPLADTEFHSCKYFNKFLEYGSIKAAGIYSKVEPFTFIIEDGKNGLLTDNNPDSWIKCLRNLIDDSKKRAEIIENASKDLKGKFTSEAIGDSIVNKIPEVSTYMSVNCSEIDVKLFEKKRNYFFFKLINILRREGVYTPVYILKKLIEKITYKL